MAVQGCRIPVASFHGAKMAVSRTSTAASISSLLTTSPRRSTTCSSSWAINKFPEKWSPWHLARGSTVCNAGYSVLTRGLCGRKCHSRSIVKNSLRFVPVCRSLFQLILLTISLKNRRNTMGRGGQIWARVSRAIRDDSVGHMGSLLPIIPAAIA